MRESSGGGGGRGLDSPGKSQEGTVVLWNTGKGPLAFRGRVVRPSRNTLMTKEKKVDLEVSPFPAGDYFQSQRSKKSF